MRTFKDLTELDEKLDLLLLQAQRRRPIRSAIRLKIKELHKADVLRKADAERMAKSFQKRLDGSLKLEELKQLLKEVEDALKQLHGVTYWTILVDWFYDFWYDLSWDDPKNTSTCS